VLCVEICAFLISLSSIKFSCNISYIRLHCLNVFCLFLVRLSSVYSCIYSFFFSSFLSYSSFFHYLLFFLCFIAFFNFFFCILLFFSMDFKCVKRQKFSHNWLENENYNSWIRKVPNYSSLYSCVPCRI